MTVHALIAGAGIGGIATALAFAQSGICATIHERVEALEEFGAGLQLPPNATRVLARLGVLDAVRKAASVPTAVCSMRGSDDAILVRIPLDDSERRWGAPYLALHRADLLAALIHQARKTPLIQIRRGSPLTAVVSNDAGVRIEAGRARSEYAADLLVGADGLRSSVREFLDFGEADRPIPLGRVAFRALVSADRVDRRWLRHEVVLRLGPAAHLVHYPLRGGSVVNLVAVIDQKWRAESDHPWDGEGDRDALNRAFANWSRSTRALLDAASSWRAWPLYSRPPLPSFARGSVALVGDAAHPMAPFLAQGAAQAIEDAQVLADALARGPTIPEALSIYSRSRVARASRVQAEAARQGRIYHLSGPMAVARDAAMRLLGGRRLGERYDWLYRA